MAKIIDPAFQAAPFLGESSHDPIEFVRRQKMLKYQSQQKREKEQELNTAKGLEKLMLDIKGWEDQKGFQEVMGSYNKNIDAFMKLSKKGLNLTSPKTESEIMAFNRLQEEHKKTAQLLDTWNRNKIAYDLFNQEMKTNPEKYDLNESRVNMEKQLKENNIQDRNLNLENILVFKPDMGDVVKKIADSKNFYIPPTQTQIFSFNPVTGQNEGKFVEDMSPEDERENVRRAGIQYEGLDKSYKNTIKQMRDADPDPLFNAMSDKDYFATIAVPTYRKKFLEKSTGTSGGFEINLGGGGKITMQPGKLRPESTPYGEKNYTNSYIWPTPTKSITVPIGSTGSEQFMGQSWVPIKEGTVEATPYLYDPATQEFVFNVTSNQNAPWVQNNRPVSIPRSVIGDLADDFPIMVNGKKTTLKEVYGTSGEPAVKTIGGKDFRTIPTYIPKKK